MSIGQRFKKVREHYRMTQSAFGESLDATQANITDVERGKVFPNPVILENIHKKYMINLNWLLCGTGKMRLDSYSPTPDYIEDSKEEYGIDYKNKYIHSLEEVVRLKDKLEWYIENCSCKEGS